MPALTTIPAYFSMMPTTPLGSIALVADADGALLLIAHGTHARAAEQAIHNEPTLTLHASNAPEKAAQALLAAQAQIEEILAGTRTDMSLPYRFIRGTPAQQRVWETLRQIPAGTTISYTEMAQRTGNPKASRAAGSACGANPLPLLCPCHRVLRSDGSLGGFGWGLDAKRWLLESERRQRPAAMAA